MFSKNLSTIKEAFAPSIRSFSTQYRSFRQPTYCQLVQYRISLQLEQQIPLQQTAIIRYTTAGSISHGTPLKMPITIF